MDHDEALRLQAAVKYVLGELPEVERDSFEEHYFDCGECALDVRAAAAFSDNARNVLGHEAREAALQAAAPGSRRWLAWLKPIVAVPAFAVLLLVIAYQNAITIPEAKKEAGSNAGQFFSSSFSLQMANTRGGEEVKARVHPNESFALKFDFTPTKHFSSYLCQLRDESGRSVLQAEVPATSINQEAQLVVPTGRVKPGKYTLVFTGVPASNDEGTPEEVLRLGFSVEFLP
ncbi:MAG TPA: zf-HC2 domain-containing protein [Candidatus Acidoferrum sp.]|nr:zf-HC2 domain-containing protein [Candidatus Acidoferrum sp.]